MPILSNDFSFGSMEDLSGSLNFGATDDQSQGRVAMATVRFDPYITHIIADLLNLGFVPGSKSPVVWSGGVPSIPQKYPTVSMWGGRTLVLSEDEKRVNAVWDYFVRRYPTGLEMPRMQLTKNLNEVGPRYYLPLIDWLTNPNPYEKVEIDAALAMMKLAKDERSRTYGDIRERGIVGVDSTMDMWNPTAMGDTWGERKHEFLGMVKFFPAYASFPWPDPKWMWKLGFGRAIGERAGINRLVYQSEYLSGTDIERMLRSEVLADIEIITGKMQEYMDEAAKKKAKGNLISGIVRAVVTLGVTAINPLAGGALAVVLGTKAQVDSAKAAAELSRQAGSVQAGLIQADMLQKQDDLRNQLDTFYTQNSQFMVGFGYPPERWNAMSSDEKIALLDGIASGAVKPVPAAPPPPAVTAPPPEVTVVAPPPAAPVPPPAITPVPPPTGLPPSMPGETMADYVKRVQAAGVSLPETIKVSAPSAPAPANRYDLSVEGRVVGSYGSLDEAAKAAATLTSPGDRFEVFVNGVSTGLRVRTATSAEEVPANIAEQVRALPAEQVKASVTAAAKTAEAKGGFPWWIIALPAAAVVAAVK